MTFDRIRRREGWPLLAIEVGAELLRSAAIMARVAGRGLAIYGAVMLCFVMPYAGMEPVPWALTIQGGLATWIVFEGIRMMIFYTPIELVAVGIITIVVSTTVVPLSKRQPDTVPHQTLDLPQLRQR